MKLGRKITFICIWMMMFTCSALSIHATDIPESSENFYVNDYANVLDDTTKEYLMNMNDEIYSKYQGQFVVVTLDSSPDIAIEDYAYQVFNAWGIGGSEHRGLLLILDINGDDYWILQGKGLEKKFTSSYLGDVLYDNLEGDFTNKNYSAGVRKTAEVLKNKFQTSFNTKNNSTTITKEKKDSEVSPLGVITGSGMLAVGGYFLVKLNKTRQQKKSQNTDDNEPSIPSENKNTQTNIEVDDIAKREEELRQKEAELRYREEQLAKEEAQHANQNDFVEGMMYSNQMHYDRRPPHHENRSFDRPASNTFTRPSSSSSSSQSTSTSSHSSSSFGSAPRSGEGGSSRGGGAGRRK